MRQASLARATLLAPLLAGVTVCTAARLDVPGDHATLQAAIDAASDGDEIVVAAGTYSGSVQIGKALLIRSAAGASATTLQGSGAGPVVRLEEGPGGGGSLSGFTITGGVGQNGGGVFLSGDVALIDCTVTGNSAQNGGGAFLVGNPLLSGVRFHGNSGVVGGAVCLAPDADALIDACEFAHNDAEFGGAVFVSPNSLAETYAVIGAASFDGNTADVGGAIAAVMSAFEADDATFLANVAWSSGGAIRLIEAAVSSVTGAEFRENEADGSGGGVCLTGGSSLTIDGAEIYANSADTTGGGLETDAASTLEVGGTALWDNLPNDIEGDWVDLGDNSFAPPPACAADLAQPFGVLDVIDMMAFVSVFIAADPAADLAAPAGVVDLADVIEFVNLYLSGCGQ